MKQTLTGYLKIDENSSIHSPIRPGRIVRKIELFWESFVKIPQIAAKYVQLKFYPKEKNIDAELAKEISVVLIPDRHIDV